MCVLARCNGCSLPKTQNTLLQAIGGSLVLHKKHTVTLSSLSGELSLYLSGARTECVRRLFGWYKLISSLSSPEGDAYPFPSLCSSSFFSLCFLPLLFFFAFSSSCILSPPFIAVYFLMPPFLLCLSPSWSRHTHLTWAPKPQWCDKTDVCLFPQLGELGICWLDWGTSPTLTRGFSIRGLQRGVVLCSFLQPAEPDARGVDVRQPDKTWGEPNSSSIWEETIGEGFTLDIYDSSDVDNPCADYFMYLHLILRKPLLH